MIEAQRLANGFEYIEVKNHFAQAKIALQGAHIFSYHKADSDRSLLWLSEKSYFEKGRAIRGGIPICWPWFGPATYENDLPQHGFARTSRFALKSSEETKEGTSRLLFSLTDTPETRKLWDFAFELEYEIIIGSELTLRLVTYNRDVKPFMLTEALHSYFFVNEIKAVRLIGLEGKTYYDALQKQNHVQEGSLHFEAEVDRIYYELDRITLSQGAGSAIHIENVGSQSIVIWNPWIEKSKSMVDMSETGYKQMLCIESANAGEDSRKIEPNTRHVLSCTIR